MPAIVAWMSFQPSGQEVLGGSRGRRLGVGHSQDMRMDSGSRYLIWASVIAVFLVLLAGLWNMLRGTSPNLSQTLMRWRVALQFLAIVIMMVLVYLLRS
jgi:hypothetical protein